MHQHLSLFHPAGKGNNLYGYRQAVYSLHQPAKAAEIPWPVRRQPYTDCFFASDGLQSLHSCGNPSLNGFRV